MTLSNFINSFVMMMQGPHMQSLHGQILLWLAQTTFIVALLIAFVMVIRKPIARMFGPQAAYALWSLPLLRFAMPELAILPQPQIQNQLLPVTFQLAHAETIQNTPDPLFSSSMIIQTLLFLWFFCALTWLCAQLVRQILFNTSVRKHSKLIEQGLYKKLLLDIPIKNNQIHIRIANDEIGPLVTGLVNPVIILPKSFMTEYNETERTMALTHELAHIQRGDLWITLGALMFRALQWPNPIIHFAWRYFRADQEAACDAVVLQKAIPALNQENKTHTYASAIVKAVKISSTAHASTRSSLPAHTLGLPLNHEIKERLMLMKSTPTPKRRLLGAGAVSAIMLASLAATAQYGYAAQDEKSSNVEEVIIRTNDGEETVINTKTISENGKTTIITTKNGKIVREDIIDDKISGAKTFILKPDGDIDTQIMTGTVTFKTNDSEQVHIINDKINLNDGGNVFIANSANRCKSIDSALQNSLKDNEQKTIKFKKKNKDGFTISNPIQLNSTSTFTIICENGELVGETGNEQEALRSAIKNLKEQEEKHVIRLQAAREQLEERLKELEKTEEKLKETSKKLKK